MSGIIRVTPAELESMAGRYSSESNQVGEQITRLNGMIKELEGAWEGEASRAFSDQYEALRPSIIQMQQLLEDISVQLRNTGKALADADSQIASQIRG
ncbi:WXG100 family type VII secretion target [Bacillus canaveralius]|uniref:ESAT-6-like protein n=1 Tax=Bacillus canaveralius TaxID=1403243 RepID=A0A2N5GMV0_9BACI|nr:MULTISPECIES: WXG100 family type VII secretion target [Bacillus]PLR82274.1 WXG100 family type VII secretion target [Bacillus sp. V33-4]PLR83449.1 WXG100 family type VII secretion target [Bacillus canaveralius]PLR95370.1 WXG100 family type VII secretion target [Bacillus canaveralius]